ncbi:MAG: mechanosensitive ion channel family protein [Flavobacteriales bacterium]|nr:mechanosensitive ion channel family protein [Flavobacteriales bacterium]
MLEASEAVDAIREKILGWSEGIGGHVANLMLATLIVLAGWFAARFIRFAALKVMRRFTDNITLHELVSSALYVATVLIGAFAALSVLNLDKTVSTLLAGAGIIGLALAFAFQDIASNFIAGVLMAAQRPCAAVNWLRPVAKWAWWNASCCAPPNCATCKACRSSSPTRTSSRGVLINYSRNGTRRVDLPVGVSYGEDLAQVRGGHRRGLTTGAGCVAGHRVDVFYQGYGDSSIDLEVRFGSLGEQPPLSDVRSNTIVAIKAAFDKEGISIPLPDPHAGLRCPERCSLG